MNHLVYTQYIALSVKVYYIMTSPFIIEKFEPVFQKYHYMSYSYIAPTLTSLLPFILLIMSTEYCLHYSVMCPYNIGDLAVPG